MLNLKPIILTALVAGLFAAPVLAQTPRTASYSGGTWGFFVLPSGGGDRTLFGGQPSFHDVDREATITIVSRDGHALSEADRTLAIGLAQDLCEQQGLQFNTQTRGHWLSGGRLGFQGACTRW